MNNKSSFTLIELLVVIAIVGVLAGIIIVSMTNATDSARIAKAKVFSTSMRDSMSQNLVSEWNFDELTSVTNGSTMKDFWGTNNCTAIGAPIVLSNNSCIFGKCLSFDGDDHFTCGNDNSLNFGAGQDFSIEAWVKYSNNSSYHLVAGKYCDTYNPGYWLDVQLNKLRLRVADQTGYSDVTTDNTYNDNQWHHVVAVADRSDLGTLYVDGVKVKTGIISNRSGTTGTAIFRIAYTSSNKIYSGLIDTIRIYNSIITSSQVKQDYYAGLKNLLVNQKITEQEYQDRLILKQ